MFSIVIPLFNKQDSIINAVQSVLNQTYKDYEIIVVDDGSTDDSVKKLEEYVADIELLSVIRKTNKGVSSARNEGIRNTKFDFIAFLDADDFWEPTYLEEQANMIRDFPEAFMWGLSWNNVHNGIKKPQRNDVPDGFRGIPAKYWERGLHLFWTSAVVVRKSLFEEVGYFDERISCGEDLDMWLRIMLKYQVAFYNKPLANYVLDAENRAMNKEISLNKHLPYFIDKYSEFRKKDDAFRKYFDKECLYRLYPYVLQRKGQKEDIKRILNEIDFSEQKISFLLRFKFPLFYYYYLRIKYLIQKDPSQYFQPA